MITENWPARLIIIMTEETEVISRTQLKSKSGEFDIESIHSVNLKGMGVSDLGCIGECIGLERLDLSYNNIAKLHRLAGLENLQFLNLSANRITSLEGLQALDNLQSLNLAGNLIGGSDSLRCLTGLDKLTSLRLRDNTKGLSNPMCMNSSYWREVVAMFSQLVVLDGERVKGRGSDVYTMFREIDEALEARTQHLEVEDSKPEEWVPDGYWDESRAFEATILGDSEQQLKDLLSSCRRLSNTADNKLEQLQSSS